MTKVDQCAFGSDWRKSTILASYLCDMSRFAGRVCTGRRGYCAFPGRKHIQLQGAAPGGRPRSSVAQEYPSAINRELAATLLDSVESELINNRIFNGF